LFLFACGSESNDIEEIENGVEDSESEIDWLCYSEEVFDIAKTQEKLVLLEVGANWCHWCHVMDDSTYSNKEVQEYLEENFVLSREDQDSRPDLYSAYKPWGWPAIIIQDANGNDLLRLRGYQERNKFLNSLKKVVANPIIIKDESVEKEEYTMETIVLAGQFEKRVDHEKGGYPWKNKFLQSVGIVQGLKMYSNEKMRAWTDLTIQQSYLLVDPAWSGVYQYSARKSWNHQHFEKLLKVQADYVKAYAMYGANTSNKEAINRAEEIVGYCYRFFGNKSALFYNSQNADLVSGVHSAAYYNLSEKERLKQGTPSVDKSIYLKENALMAQSILYLWAATNKKSYLSKTRDMTDEILSMYKSENGLFVRELGKDQIFAFEDNRTLLDLLLKMYQLTGDQNYLTEASELGKNIETQFTTDYGFISVVGEGKVLPTYVDLDNINSVITYNLLGHLACSKSFANIGLTAYEKTDKAALHKKVSYLPLLQMAEEQLQNEPFHAVFLNDGKQRQLGLQLYSQLLLHPSQYITFEWLGMDELSEEQEMMYGGLPAGTLFMCTSSYCSAPIYDVDGLTTFLKNI